jgi:hypothetical protein
VNNGFGSWSAVSSSSGYRRATVCEHFHYIDGVKRMSIPLPQYRDEVILPYRPLRREANAHSAVTPACGTIAGTG